MSDADPSPSRPHPDELRRILAVGGADLTPAALEDLASVFEPVPVRGGEAVVRAGEAWDAGYLIVHGRFRVVRPRPDGSVEPLGERGRGQSIGLPALLMEGESPITVEALRDSALLRMTRDDFLRVAARHRDVLLAVARDLAGHLNALSGARTPAGKLAGIAVLPLDPGLGDSVTALITALRQYRSVTHLTPEGIDRELGDGAAQSSVTDERNARVVAYLHRLEEDGRLLVYECEPGKTEWTARALRQADRILVVAPGAAPPASVSVDTSLRTAGLDPRRARLDLVLVHEPETEQPEGTRPWLEMAGIERLHHVRRGTDADFARTARRLTNRAVGLVLGGGGARGIAHVGVFQALEEAGIAVDLIGGTSIGALFGAALARGWSLDFIKESLREQLAPKRAVVDVTFPIVSVLAGAKLEAILQRFFGGLGIEDLWHDFFCISASISGSGMRVHDRGALWEAIRASVALPGIFPPVLEGDELLVDGGIMDNVPVDIMSHRVEGGPIIAVNLAGKASIPVDPDYQPTVSGWRALGRRLAPWTEAPRLPGILEVIVGATNANRESYQRDWLSPANVDLLLEPPVAEFGLLEFEAFEKILEAGYRYASERLSEWSLPERAPE